MIQSLRRTQFDINGTAMDKFRRGGTTSGTLCGSPARHAKMRQKREWDFLRKSDCSACNRNAKEDEHPEKSRSGRYRGDFLRKSRRATGKSKNPKTHRALGFWLLVPRVGLEPTQPFRAKGFSYKP